MTGRNYSATCVRTIFSLLVFSLPTLLAFKAGHVEPVPGSTVMRKISPSPSAPPSPANHSLSSRAAILMKLNGPRRAPTGFSQELSSAPSASAPRKTFSRERGDSSHSTEKSLEQQFIRFPSVSAEVKPPSGNGGTIKTPQNRYHYRRPDAERKQKIASLITPTMREEPSSLFVGDDEVDFGSSMYYTTGSDSLDRYSHERQHSDLYGKQSGSEISKVVASVNHSKSLNNGSGSSSNSSNNNNKNIQIQPTSTVPPTLSKPTLLPGNYLSLATFRHIDGTLEKSSSNILSRIANFWKNLGGRNSTSGLITYKNSSSLGTHEPSKPSLIKSNSISSTKSVEDDAYIDFNSDMDLSSSIDFEYADNVSLNDDDANHVNRSSSHSSTQRHPPPPPSDSTKKTQSKKTQTQSESSQQPKYLPSSIEESGKRLGTSKQYLSLENEQDAAADAEHSHNHHHHHPNHNNNPHRDHDPRDHHATAAATSVEDYLSEISAGDLDNYSDLSQNHNSFHEDLFHTPSGTITAVIEKKERSRDHLLGSGTTLRKNVVNSGGSSSGESFQPTATTARPVPAVITKGDVRRAESDKVWSIDSHFARNELIESVEEEENEFYHGMTIGGFLKRELWTIPLFVLASLNMILIILFEVYVLCRARGQSRRHLFLGQMLLFGLFLCSFLALMFAVHPSIVGCFVGRLGVGITYSLIFSVLMVKCVFLLSLDAGIYLPTSYQGILLFFAVMVQVAIDTQWVIMYPPFLQTVESGRSMLLQCGTSFLQLLYSLSYVGFLVLMVGFLAGRAAYKGVVENFRESVYILITAVVTIPVALSWTVAGWMLQGRHQDACVSFGLVAHSLTTFLIMFMPKGRQLASLDKEAVCFEDQEDQCSGYSPSFFHFKPSTKNYKTTLWGDGNLYTTLEPTVSTINPNVFFHRNDFHSGMIY